MLGQQFVHSIGNLRVPSIALLGQQFVQVFHYQISDSDFRFRFRFGCFQLFFGCVFCCFPDVVVVVVAVVAFVVVVIVVVVVVVVVS